MRTVEQRSRRLSRIADYANVALREEGGYAVLILVMLILMAMGGLSATLLATVGVNQQHVRRDRAYTQSIAVAEAGLNQYLWMIASGTSSEFNNFNVPGNTGSGPPWTVTFPLNDPYDGSQRGVYSIQITPPTPTDSRVLAKVTGKATAVNADKAPRTIEAHLGRPSFCQYVELVNDALNIMGPADRQWFGKTHSNTSVNINTGNINDIISCARASYGGSPGVYSSAGIPRPAGLWVYPVPPVSFDALTSDFARLNTVAASNGASIPYATALQHPSTQGWYIQLLPGKKYNAYRVTGENDTTSGSLTYNATPTYSNVAYPSKGVIYVNDNVWIQGQAVDGRVTIASSGQLNTPDSNGKSRSATTTIHVIGDLTYSAGDGSVAVGLIAQQNVEVPAYAPINRSGSPSTKDMDLRAAYIAQKGCFQANSASPKRRYLNTQGSEVSYGSPSIGAGFIGGTQQYDPFLLYNPPPYFPMVGTFQILDWRELPSTAGLPLP
jgi:hypothetical protein